MLNINIISSGNSNKFSDHWDKDKFPESDYCIEFNSNKDIVWDCVVVYEDFHDKRTIRCKQGGLIYFSGEPPLMHPLSDSYLAQFDIVICPHKNIHHRNKILSHGYLNWFYCYSFSSNKKTYTFKELKNLYPKKSKNISIITSSQKMMPGHNLRMKIIEQLKRDFPGQIDFYGKGVNFIDSKREGIEEYRFHICMENSYIDNYWTEKIADSFLGLSIPIYAGCTNIDKYFNNKGYYRFEIKDYMSLHTIIKKILINPEEEYKKKLPSLIENRNILMDKENIIPFLIEHFQEQKETLEFRECTINGLNLCPHSFSFLKLRFIRFIMKLYYKII